MVSGLPPSAAYAWLTRVLVATVTKSGSAMRGSRSAQASLEPDEGEGRNGGICAMGERRARLATLAIALGVLVSGCTGSSRPSVSPPPPDHPSSTASPSRIALHGR